ncbi:uncharacterized protein YjcR [Hydrogenoanaerobacterium saccharovorans]|uniref:Uncharacterized protein YjcR n=1 Tax=Hydrogenoanaerobacterium saccharovorans TaxID=474960 RepID=A0A1H7ZZJ1_9FIRM|nr:phage terminase small subunit [Hydrogenoanaerobacterium saccharovorans]RPF48247.1 uncharacterized protein YjcR [Hydrogenoanaerobacterium saccharovorans]SEM64092.1 Uncharacterized protein YjcR [Hydrogenoanaerobacterium saccharovorans]
MARPRSPQRDKAKEKWLQSCGKITVKQLAESMGIPSARIRKWKSEDKWRDELDEIQSKRCRGGQPGNQNAAGAGAPIKNNNAETHGAYSTVHLDDLPQKEREYIMSITLDTRENMLRELQLLIAKESDLKKKMKALETESDEALHIDKVVEMLVPESDTAFKTNMKTVMKASSFDRTMKLEAEYNKIHGRIIKLLDSIKSYELEKRRIQLEERKYNLAKQRIKGEYEINPETGEIDDESDNLCAELEV